MTEAERKRVLRNLGPASIAVLRNGKVDGEVLIEAARRMSYWIRQAQEINRMLEAARDPREAAVDAHLRKSKEKP